MWHEIDYILGEIQGRLILFVMLMDMLKFFVDLERGRVDVATAVADSYGLSPVNRRLMEMTRRQL